MGDTFDASAQAAQEYTKSEGMTFIDPFDDYNVQAGQGTVAYEIYEQAQEEVFPLIVSWFQSEAVAYLWCGYLYQGCGTIYGGYWC